MNRRELLKAAGIAGLASQVSVRASAVAPDENGESPAAFAPTADGATVIWPVAGPSLGWVEYGLKGQEGTGLLERGDRFGFIPHGNQVLRVRLRGLQPGATYWYRTHTQTLEKPDSSALGREVRAGQVYELTVPNPSAAETRFAIWNDTHDHPDTLARLGELTRSEPADFLLWNGDVSNNINTEAMIPGLYLRPRGGVDLAKGPAILFNRGNHDVRGAAAHCLPGYVDYPEGRPYYSFRSGPVGGILLDTGEDKPDDHPSFLGLVDFASLIAEQARWLEQEIEKPHLKDAPYRVVFCHIPLRWRDESPQDYSKSGFDRYSRRGRDAWQPAIVRWGAQIVVSGHTHQPYHMPATSDFPYEQLIGGGPKLDTNARLIRVHADERSLTFRTIDAKDGREVHNREFRPLV